MEDKRYILSGNKGGHDKERRGGQEKEKRGGQEK
jgi:hypothetical protein